MAALTEWAQQEKLGPRFKAGIEDLVKQGGLWSVVVQRPPLLYQIFYSGFKPGAQLLLLGIIELGIGIMLPAMRKKILHACRRKLMGNKRVRFGEVLRFEPILHKKPSTKCPWLEIDEIEVRHDNLTLQAAIRTWRFCTTGVDGLEEISLLRDAFEIWRPQKKAGYRNRIEVRPGVIWISSRVHLEFIWILHDSSCI